MQEQEITILRELIIILAASLPITYLFHRAKLPALVGFLITGVLIGPFGTAIITETQVIERLAEVGVVLLLFTVGMEFSIADIARSGRRLLIGGGSQVVLTIVVIMSIALTLGYPLPQAVFFGFLASLSSTAIVLKVYSDRAELDTTHGRLSTGILLFQDIAVVPMMLLLPILGEAGTAGAVSPLSIVISLGKAVIGLIAVFIAARQVVPFLLHQVIRLKNREIPWRWMLMLKSPLAILTGKKRSISVSSNLAKLNPLLRQMNLKKRWNYQEKRYTSWKILIWNSILNLKSVNWLTKRLTMSAKIRQIIP